jgi:hypothetical protein
MSRLTFLTPALLASTMLTGVPADAQRSTVFVAPPSAAAKDTAPTPAPATPGSTPSTCVLTVAGKDYLNGPCQITQHAERTTGDMLSVSGPDRYAFGEWTGTDTQAGIFVYPNGILTIGWFTHNGWRDTVGQLQPYDGHCWVSTETVPGAIHYGSKLCVSSQALAVATPPPLTSPPPPRRSVMSDIFSNDLEELAPLPAAQALPALSPDQLTPIEANTPVPIATDGRHCVPLSVFEMLRDGVFQRNETVSQQSINDPNPDCLNDPIPQSQECHWTWAVSNDAVLAATLASRNLRACPDAVPAFDAMLKRANLDPRYPAEQTIARLELLTDRDPHPYIKQVIVNQRTLEHRR